MDHRSLDPNQSDLPPESRLSQNAFLVGSEVWSKIEIGVCLVFLIAESFVPPCIVPVGLFSGRNLFSKRFSCFSQNVSFSSFPCGQLSALQECDPNYPPIRPCFRSPQHFLYQGSCQVQNLCKLYVNEKNPKGINERFNVQMQFKCHYTPIIWMIFLKLPLSPPYQVWSSLIFWMFETLVSQQFPILIKMFD